MKKFKFLPLILLLCMAVSLFAAPFAQAAGPELSATAALLIDRRTGEELFAKSADKQIYPASTTKIMTLLLAVEAVESGSISLDDNVTASANITRDLEDAGSSAGIEVGETLPLNELLYCAMLASANEACNIIAEHVSGSIDAFVQAMNARAKDLGCTGTHFVNTHGLPNSDHYSTARDISLISLEASRHSLFMQVCGTTTHTVPATNKSGERELNNSNALLCVKSMYGSGYLFDGCSGMKTGHTTAAGYCLVSTAEHGTRQFLSLVFGEASSDLVFRDSAKLLNWGFAEPAPSLFAGRDNFDLDIDSAAAVVLNQADGEVFYLKNADVKRAPADLVKLMTALLAAEAIEAGSFSLSSEVTVTANAFSDLPTDAARLLSEGEVLPMESLLYCVLLASADDACNVIAEYVSGSIPEFVKQMNERAAQLGCTDTRFVNTHGLQDDRQHSTASDLALIALEAARTDLLARICATKAAELSETNINAARTVQSTNPLVNENSPYGASYFYPQASGLKSAFSAAAGFCVASTASDDASGISLVSVVLGGSSGESGVTCFTDTRKLCDYVFSHYSYQEILRSKENIASVDVLLGADSDYVNLHPASSISLLLPNDFDQDSFKKEITIYSLKDGSTPTAPISAGDVLGEVNVTRNGVSYGVVKLVASSSVDLSRLQYLKSQMKATTQSRTFKIIFWSVIVFFAAYLIWVIIYRVKRVKHLLALRDAENARAQAAVSGTTILPPAPEIEFFEPEPETLPEPEGETAPPEEPEIEPIPFPAHQSSAPAPEPVVTPEPAAPASEPETAGSAQKQPDDDLPFLREQADRDYFEEFFRRK